jgi:hypothetical protein
VRTVQLRDALENSQPCADGTLGVVAVRARSSEDGHDGVPDELLHHAAVLLDPLLRLGVVELQLVADVLGVGPLCPRREADEIHEEHRHELSLLSRWRRVLEPGAAVATEARLGRHHDAAARAA